MAVLMIFRIALKALGRNKMRTALTMLGMIIGVAAVITMVALGKGAQSTIEAQVKAAGTNLITINSGNFTQGGVRQGGGMSTTLTVEDAQALRSVAGVQYLAAGVNSRAQLIAGNQNWSSQIQGTDVELPLIRNWPTKYGAFFTAQDVSSAAKVAVLGQTVSDNLFGPDVDPTGQIMRVKNQPFKVIGVMSPKGSTGCGDDQDDAVYAPYTTVQKKLQGIQHINNVTISASSPETAPVSAAIAEALRARHKLMGSDPDDFMVRTQEEMASVRTETTKTMTTLLAAIAGVSLLVGGIGIMNIMLVSVTERTREIGLRLAVGARQKDILRQFLFEATGLAAIGGAVGVLIGVAAAYLISNAAGWPLLIQPESILLAVAFSGLVGVFFGWYPALRASRLDPIEALRHT
jgi:putative ABC transport system permease protein